MEIFRKAQCWQQARGRRQLAACLVDLHTPCHVGASDNDVVAKRSKQCTVTAKCCDASCRMDEVRQ